MHQHRILPNEDPIRAYVRGTLLCMFARRDGATEQDWCADMVKSGLMEYVPESVFKDLAPHHNVPDGVDCEYMGKTAVFTESGLALANVIRASAVWDEKIQKWIMPSARERDLRRYSAEQAKPLTAFFGRPVHALTLDEIETFKTLAESVTVSETKDGFAVEIANVDLDRHIHETGTPVTLAGVEFMHRT